MAFKFGTKQYNDYLDELFTTGKRPVPGQPRVSALGDQMVNLEGIRDVIKMRQQKVKPAKLPGVK